MGIGGKIKKGAGGREKIRQMRENPPPPPKKIPCGSKIDFFLGE